MIPLTPAVVRQHAMAMLRKAPGARVIGIRSQGAWSGPPVLRLEEGNADIVAVISPLHARELLAERPTDANPLILLTSLADDELGRDVVARLAGRQVLIPDPWSLVKEAFRARDLDPRLLAHQWMAAALLEAEPPSGYSPVAAGVLDSETAWGLVLEQRLGLRSGRPDLVALLDWLVQPDSLTRLRQLPDDMRNGLRGWIVETAGSAAGAMLEAATRVDARELVAIGLAALCLFTPEGEIQADARDAVIRLEPLVGGRALTPADGRAWGQAALAAVRHRGRDERIVRGWLDRGDELLAELGAPDAVWRSDVSPRGFDRRCLRCVRAVSVALDDENRAIDLDDAAGELRRVREHRLAEPGPHRERVERLGMAVRLARWLAQVEPPPVRSFGEAARRHLQEGSFAEWACVALRGGDPLAEVGSLYTRLMGAARARREGRDREFASFLAGWLDTGGSHDGLLLTERVLADVVAPAAEDHAVLVVVMDGMSAPVFHELADSLVADGWVPVAREGCPAVLPVIAPLPTVTEVCRASLLAGVLTTGTQMDEKRGFAAHQALVAVSRSEKPPLLLHKGDLTDGSLTLAATVRQEIESDKRRVVGVVLNAVDDHLLKADQVHSVWTLSTVPLLHALLHAARLGKRLVVVTADHGHVLENGTVVRPGGESDRWRPVSAPPGEDEFLFRGPRVLAEGHACVAAVTEGLRYRSRKNGYHGGATASEVVVPLAVFAPDPTVQGWGEAGLRRPEWWEHDAVSMPIASPVPPTSVVAQPMSAAPLLQIAEGAESAASDSVMNRLLASPVFQSQREQHARLAIDEARVRAILEALLARGGRITRAALASQLGVAPIRLGGQITALRSLLNVEAYPVLTVDDRSDTVELNLELLRTQFEL